MTQKSAIKYLLDLIMLIMMIVLMAFSLTGDFLHEIIGITLFVLFITHCILNRKWYKSSLKILFTGKYKFSSRLWTVVNYLVHIDMVLMVITSAFISNILLLNVGNYGDIAFLHKVFAYAGLVLISLHTGFHGSLILKQSGKAFGLSEKNSARTWAARLLSLIIIALGIWSFSNRISSANKETQQSTNSISSVSSVSTNYSTSEKYTPHNMSLSFNSQSYSTNSDTVTINNIQKMSMIFSETIEPGETLDEFLSRLYCTGCSKHCPLSSPRCGRGMENAAEAQSYYENNSSNNETTITQEATEEITTTEEITDSQDSQTETEPQTEDENSTTQIEATTEPVTTENSNSINSNSNETKQNDLFDFAAMSGGLIVLSHYGTKLMRKAESSKKGKHNK